MVLRIMKYSELNFPALSDFGKIRNYMIIHNVIHFGYFGNRSSRHSKMLNMLVKWDEACFVEFGIVFRGIMYGNLVLPLLFARLMSTGSFKKSGLMRYCSQTADTLAGTVGQTYRQSYST